jgi:hypothetical protein
MTKLNLIYQIPVPSQAMGYGKLKNYIRHAT